MESILFSISGRDDFANQILRVANYYSEYPSKAILGECNVQKFSDGELCVDFNTSVEISSVSILILYILQL